MNQMPYTATLISHSFGREEFKIKVMVDWTLDEGSFPDLEIHIFLMYLYLVERVIY